MKIECLYDSIPNSINTIVVDLFDTLLLYKVYEHERIFEIVGEKLKENFDFPYGAETYRKVRAEIEKHNTKGRGCSLKKLLSFLPFSDEIKDAAYDLEMEAEVNNTVLNQELYCFLSEHDYKYVLVSNTYFSKYEINKIIQKKECQLRFSDCIIPSTIGYKEDESLIYKIASIYARHSTAILSRNGSYLKEAKSLEFFAIQYGKEPYIFDMFSFEKIIFGKTVESLRFIRELATMMSASEGDNGNKFFFEIGASIIAPVYAMYAEWIIDFAKKHQITHLMPLMREGTVLSDCINTISNDNTVTCKPIYCSRRSLFVATITEDNFDNKISSIMMKSKAAPNILFGEIGVDLSNTIFSKYTSMSEIEKNNMSFELKKFLDTQKNEILKYCNNQRKLICKMLEHESNNEKTATVDIGFSGTSEGFIRDILALEHSKADISHLILMGSDGKQIDNILSGLKIYSWLGMAGENTDITKHLMYQIQILEILINDICGTTLRYDSDCCGNPIPVIDIEKPYGIEENYEKTLACQRGVKTYMRLWKNYRSKLPLSELMEDKKGFINIWKRLIEMPSYVEAINIGNLKLYDNYTNEKKLYKVIGSSDHLTDDIENYLDTISKNTSDYPQALVSINYPNYFNKLLIEHINEIPGIKRMYKTIDQLKEELAYLGEKMKIGIFAAGQRGRDFLNLANIFNVPIECFIDSDKKLVGYCIEGIEVKNIKDAFNITHFINASYNYPDEITNIINKTYGDKKPKIFVV